MIVSLLCFKSHVHQQNQNLYDNDIKLFLRGSFCSSSLGNCFAIKVMCEQIQSKFFWQLQGSKRQLKLVLDSGSNNSIVQHYWDLLISTSSPWCLLTIVHVDSAALHLCSLVMDLGTNYCEMWQLSLLILQPYVVFQRAATFDSF